MGMRMDLECVRVWDGNADGFGVNERVGWWWDGKWMSLECVRVRFDGGMEMWMGLECVRV